jgi:nucleoid DNA-binding protein
MKKADLARRLAKRVGVSPAEAADQLDRVVNGILTDLRKGQTAQLPGLGTFTAGRGLRFKFEPKAAKKTHVKGK